MCCLPICVVQAAVQAECTGQLPQGAITYNHCRTCAQPEFLSDVQKCSKAVYMRTAEAAQCNVRSVLLLPLFGDPQRRVTIGVVEVAQSTDRMPADNVVTALAAALKASAHACRPRISSNRITSQRSGCCVVSPAA